MLLKNGLTSYEVGIVQNNLKMLGFYPFSIDYIFGNETETAVKKFQGFSGLIFNGQVDDNILSKLQLHIKDIQKALNSQGHDLIVDGIAGINTYNALSHFQKKNDLTADGIAKYETSSVLFKGNFGIYSNYYDISSKGINFIADYENITEADKKNLLKKDLSSFIYLVNTMVLNLGLSQNQFDALVSFSYNRGVTALYNSTLLKDIKAEASYEIIEKDFLMYCDCNKEHDLNQYHRRSDEFKLYSCADYTGAYRNF